MSELLYEPGDIVMIRSDLKTGDYPVLYGPNEGETLFCNGEMRTFAGQTDEIECYDGGFDDNSFYRLKKHPWLWTESMFESAQQNECFCHSLL